MIEVGGYEMKKILIKIMIFICLLLSLLILLFHKFIFQEGNPIPIAYSILKLNITKIEYVRATYNPEKYIFKCNDYEDKGIKTLGNILYNKGFELTNEELELLYLGKRKSDITNVVSDVRKFTSNYTIVELVDELSAEQIVREHFRWRNEKNLPKLKGTMTKENKGISWMIENLNYIKLLNIQEDKSDNAKAMYMNNGKGLIKNPSDVKVFKVQYEVKYIDDNKGPEQDGKYECVFYVVKEQKDSYWLIDTWGY